MNDIIVAPRKQIAVTRYADIIAAGELALTEPDEAARRCETEGLDTMLVEAAKHLLAGAPFFYYSNDDLSAHTFRMLARFMNASVTDLDTGPSGMTIHNLRLNPPPMPVDAAE
jgi:hypothetical protein